MKQYIAQHINGILLSASTSSWGLWLWLGKLSAICATLLPITGVLSFLILVGRLIYKIFKNEKVKE